VLISHYLELARYYKWVLAVIAGGITILVALFSVFLLFATPLYTGTATVTMLSTDAELAYTKAWSGPGQFDPATIMTASQTEYLLSRPVVQRTVDHLIQQFGSTEQAAPTGLKRQLRVAFTAFKSALRRTYNYLNSGRNVPIDAYDDAVLTMQDNIEVEAIEGSFMMQISVSWDNPKVAAAAANYLAQAYVDEVQEEINKAADTLSAKLRGQINAGQGDLSQTAIADLNNRIATVELSRSSGLANMRVVDPAVPPNYPSFPLVVIYTLIGMAASVVLACFALVVLDTFSDTVKTRVDLERVMGERNLGFVRRGIVPLVLTRPAPRSVRPLLENMRNRLIMLGAGRQPGAIIAYGDEELARRALAIVTAALDEVISPALTGPDESVHDLLPVSEPPVLLPTTSSRRGWESIRPGVLWLVIAMRPGTASEAELNGIVAAARQRQIPNVFGILLEA
jgi:capsular polysaccharide biosynthesis protein